MPVELSVVVPTYNSAAVLPGLLDGFGAQTLAPERFEVILVDDGSCDSSEAIVAGHRRTHPGLGLRWYRQDHALGGAARNRGIAESRAPIVLFLDSDMVPFSGLLHHHLVMHRRHPEPEVAVLGRVSTGRRYVELVSPDGEDAAVRLAARGQLSPIAFASGNVSLKRDWLAENGLFRPGLPCLQDVDLALRLAEKGLTLLYCAEACALHTRPLDSVDKVIASGRKYGLTLAEWYDRVPQFHLWREHLGGRFSGGGAQLRRHPGRFIKDWIVRRTVNGWTVGALERVARCMPVTAPPGRFLVRCCIELWAFHYRDAFRVRRRELRRQAASLPDAAVQARHPDDRPARDVPVPCVTTAEGTPVYR
jgi:glycosyltransferase involved in cell wall biosynthesis